MRDYNNDGCWLIVFNWCHSNDDDAIAAAATSSSKLLSLEPIIFWLIPSIYLCFDMFSLVMSQPQIIIYNPAFSPIFKFSNNKGLLSTV